MKKVRSISGIVLLAFSVLGFTVTLTETVNALETGTQAVSASPTTGSGEYPVAAKIFTGEAIGDAFGNYLDTGKDVDGDGHTDLLVGAPRHGSRKGRAYLFYGGPNMDTKPDKVFNGEEVGDLFGVGVVLGDINGDRYADVIVGAPGYNSEQGKVYVFYGGPEMDTNPDKVFSPEKDTSGWFGRRQGTGDLNGDKCPDLTVCAARWDDFRGRVYIFYGSPGADMDTTVDMILDGENPGDRFGRMHTLGKDVNGDGHPDLVVGAESWPNNNKQGRAYLYYGGPNMDTTPDVIFTGEAGEPGGQFGYANELSDIDRDGFVDVIIGAPFFNRSRGRAYLFFGGPDMDNVADRIFNPEQSSGQAHLGTAIACGHMNPDRFTDIALGCPGHSDFTGQACVYFGAPGRSMDQNPDKVFEGTMPQSYFGVQVKLADFNSDWTHDLLVAANMYNPVQGKFQGRVYLYYGEPFFIALKTIPGLEEKPTKSLFQAAADSDIQQIKLHILCGTNVNEKTVSGETALHYAAGNGDKHVVELLLAKGADVNAKNVNGNTPGHFALGGHHKVVLDLLIAKGAKLSSIHFAAYQGDLAKVRSFIEGGTDIDARDPYGATALHYAARRGSKEVVDFLVDKGADVNAKDEGSFVPLHSAASQGQKDVVRLLITKGADVNAKDKDSFVPLHFAASEGHRDVVELLIAKGADVNAKDKWGWTPLDAAAWDGHKHVAELLIAAGADVNSRYGWGETPLIWAAQQGHTAVAELLIANDADVNAKDNQGLTPLWYAENSGHTEMVELLRKHETKE